MRILHAPALAVLLGPALCGCADFSRAVSLPPVNAESPVAATVRAGAPLNYDMPRLSDVPPVPKNVPPASDVKAGVVSMVRCRGGITRFAADHPPLSGAAEQFASNARAVAQTNPADVPPPDSAAKSDAAAAELRAYASAPSAYAAGPAPNANEGKPADLQTPQPAPPKPAAPPPAPAHPARGRTPRSRAAAATPAAAPVAAAAVAAPVSADTPPPPPIPGAMSDPYYARCS